MCEDFVNVTQTDTFTLKKRKERMAKSAAMDVAVAQHVSIFMIQPFTSFKETNENHPSNRSATRIVNGGSR